MRRPLLALACVATIYAILAFAALPRNAFFSSDEGLKLIQLQNFVRKGFAGFSLDYPGRGLDPDLSYVPINNPPPLIRDGTIYAAYPVFFPLLATPLFSLVGYAGLYVIPLVSGLLTLLFSCWLARINNSDGTPLVLILGLCTPLLFYSLLFWDHTLGTALSTLALLLLAKSLLKHRSSLLLVAGLILALSIWVRTELYVMAIVMPLAYLVSSHGHWRRALIVVGAIYIGLLPLWVFQWLVYGNALGPHLGHFASLAEALPVTTNRLAIIYYTLLDAHSNPLITFLFIMAFVASTIVLWSRRLRRNRVLVRTVFGLLFLGLLPSLCEAWSGRPIGGLVATTPFLAYSFAALSNRQPSSTDRMMTVVFVGYISLVCLATPVDPGLQWGPRFLLPALPAGVLLAMSYHRTTTRERRRSSTSRTLTAGLVAVLAVSLISQVCGLRVMQVVKTRDQQLIEATAGLDSLYIVSDEYGYAQYVAPLFYEREFFYVRSQTDYQALVKTFLLNGIHRYAVTTYPAPHRRAIDPLAVSGGYVVREVDQQLYEIGRVEQSQ